MVRANVPSPERPMIDVRSPVGPVKWATQEEFNVALQARPPPRWPPTLATELQSEDRSSATSVGSRVASSRKWLVLEPVVATSRANNVCNL